MPTITANEDAIRPFLSSPWCMKLIRDPAYTVDIPLCRDPVSPPDDFFARAMNTPDCVPAIIGLDKKPTKPDGLVEERLTLFAIGRGIQGYAGIVHGGMVAAMLDEAVASIIQTNLYEGSPWGNTQKLMTKFLNITYLRPVPTPAFLQCLVKLDKVEDERKVFYNASLKDGEGNDLANAEAMFIKVKAKL